LIYTIQWFKDNWDNIEKDSKFGPGISSFLRDADFVTGRKARSSSKAGNRYLSANF
jgi:hypothetical protein